MYSGMALEQRLDLERKDVLTAAYEHVIAPPNEIIETFFVAAAYVAGVVPAITQAIRRLSRQVVIAKQHAGILHRKFTFTRVQAAHKLRLGSGIGHADRAGRTRLAFGMWAERHRPSLSNAVHDQRFGVRKIFL